MIFSPFHFIALGITLHLLHDLVDLLQLQINDIIHQSLGKAHMLLEEFIIEISILGERVHHIAVEVDAQQPTGIVRTKWYLPTRIRGYCTEAQVGIAVGNTLPENGIPKQYARLSTLPCIMYNLLPQILGTDSLLHIRMITIHRELLNVLLIIDGSLHERIIDLHAHVSSRHLSFSHLRINECF